MGKRELACKRLGYNSGDNTYKLTIPPEIVDSNKWKSGQTLYLRNNSGILTYSDKEDTMARKIRLQKTNVYSVRIPARIIEYLKFKPGQLFNFSSGAGYVSFNPYSGSKLLGVAKKKITVNNLPMLATTTTTATTATTAPTTTTPK